MKYKVAKVMCVAVALTLSPATGVMATELKDGGKDTVLESSSSVLREEEVAAEKEPTEKEATEKEPTVKEAVDKVATVKEPTVKEAVDKVETVKDPTMKEAVDKELTEKEAVEKNPAVKDPAEEEPAEKEPTEQEPIEKELVEPVVSVEPSVEIPLEATLTIHHVLHLDVGEIRITEEIGSLGTQDSFNEADYVMDLKDDEILFLGETKEVKLIQGKNEITLDYGFKEKEQLKEIFSEER